MPELVGWRWQSRRIPTQEDLLREEQEYQENRRYEHEVLWDVEDHFHRDDIPGSYPACFQFHRKPSPKSSFIRISDLLTGSQGREYAFHSLHQLLQVWSTKTKFGSIFYSLIRVLSNQCAVTQSMHYQVVIISPLKRRKIAAPSPIFGHTQFICCVHCIPWFIPLYQLCPPNPVFYTCMYVCNYIYILYIYYIYIILWYIYI